MEIPPNCYQYPKVHMFPTNNKINHKLYGQKNVDTHV